MRQRILLLNETLTMHMLKSTGYFPVILGPTQKLEVPSDSDSVNASMFTTTLAEEKGAMVVIGSATGTFMQTTRGASNRLGIARIESEGAESYGC